MGYTMGFRGSTLQGLLVLTFSRCHRKAGSGHVQTNHQFWSILCREQRETVPSVGMVGKIHRVVDMDDGTR